MHLMVACRVRVQQIDRVSRCFQSTGELEALDIWLARPISLFSYATESSLELTPNHKLDSLDWLHLLRQCSIS